MKMKKYIHILLVLFSACARLEGPDYEPSSCDKVRMQLCASIDSESQLTKTYLDGEPIASVRNTYWLPNDNLAVAGSSAVALFTNTNKEKSEMALFEGEAEISDVYYALYPYTSYVDPVLGKGHSFKEGIMRICIPEVQKYEPNTFATDMVPMVARFAPGERLLFKNVCGGLVLKLSGSERIVSATLTLYDESGVEMPVCGHFSVDMNSEQYTLEPLQEAVTNISLDCGEGVQLTSNEPTAFHFVLPPAKYKGFKATFLSEDGKYMVISTDKNLNIRRSNITYVSSVKFEDNLQYVDLSLYGTSNCYIVSGLGAYFFDATVIGNGKEGIEMNSGFHTENASIVPSSVKVLWQDTELESVKNVRLVDGKIYFTTTGVEGNTVIAVKDNTNEIVWSWHIWVTDRPKEQQYNNSVGSFAVLDRNLGATIAYRGSEKDWEKSMGMLYFWGRKDPFCSDNMIKVGGEHLTIGETITNPTIKHTSGSWSSESSWMTPKNTKLWSYTKKTIYDPCPVGYRVTAVDIWTDFIKEKTSSKNIEDFNIKDVYYNGYEFYINPQKTEVAWYPMTHRFTCHGQYLDDADYGCCWGVNPNVNTTAKVDDCYLSYLYQSKYNAEVSRVYNASLFGPMGEAFPVRCMRDEGYDNIALPKVSPTELSDVTTSSVIVSSSVERAGAGEIIDKGFIFGVKPDLSDAVKISCGHGENNFITKIADLKRLTKYYIRSYVVNKYGEVFSEIKSFTTTYEDGVINLSLNGTSNCYIVSDVNKNHEYAFDCTVKGNSSNLIGTPKTMEVLWETIGCSATASHGSLISSLGITDNFATFRLVNTAKEGNALIAAKDASGRILWSWHIWVTDVPQEQTYQNYLGEFQMLDRNIGATRPDRGVAEEWKDSRGLVYFWGRKDPFWYGSYEHVQETLTLDFSIEHPTTRHSASRWDFGTSSWLNIPDFDLWKPETKTMYDPCPVGYRVPDHTVWRGFTKSGESSENKTDFNVAGQFNKGYEFYINEAKSETAWFPVSYSMNKLSGHGESTTEGYIWSSDWNKNTRKCSLVYSENRIWINHLIKDDGDGLPVRCVREE